MAIKFMKNWSKFVSLVTIQLISYFLSMNLMTPATMLLMPPKIYSCRGASPYMKAGAVTTLLASSV